MPFLRVILALLRSRFLAIFAFLGKLYLALAAYKAFGWTIRASVLTAFVLWIPLPGWLIALPGYLAAIPSGAAFMLTLAQFRPGLGIVLGALVIRFVARLVLRALD